MISISKVIISEDEKKAVLKVLESGNIVQGPVVKNLEDEFVKLSTAKFAVATNNGTAALHTALHAIGLKPGDEVITTPFTFVASANSILMAGGKAVFVDIDEKTFNLDPKLIEKAVTKKTKAILVVNLYGQPADYKEIRSIAKKHNLLIVEDAAQSVDAEYYGNKSGNLGDISCFSLYATKNIMSGEGGMITTNNKKFYEKAKLFRHHGQDEKVSYKYKDLGYNYRLTDMQAAIAIEQLKKLKQITKKRQANAEFFNKAFRGVPGLQIPEVSSNRTHVYHQYTLRVTKEFKLKRDEVMDRLLKKGVQTKIFYPYPLHKIGHFESKAKLPVAEKVAKEVFSLPIHPFLSQEDLSKIKETVLSLYGESHSV